MGLFSRSKDNSAEAQEYRAAKSALKNDPVNNGSLGTVDADSAAGRRNLAAQDRLNRAERAYKRR
jgi:hypothetical protein